MYFIPDKSKIYNYGSCFLLKENQEYKRHWRKFIIFTLIVGLVVGVISVISDNLPNLADDVTVLEFIISYLAITINSLPMWFIIAMLVGYLFANNISKAAILGSVYTICAITFYFAIGHFYIETTVSSSFKEQTLVYAIWGGASAIGGILGGITGFFLKKTPYALLILLVGLILQLFVNGTFSWGNVVGIAQSVTFCLMIVSIVFYIVIVKRKKEPNWGT
jgi:MFS family permease